MAGGLKLTCGSLVHVYFVVTQLVDTVNGAYTTACQQCRSFGPLPKIILTFGEHGGADREGYAPLLDGEGRPTVAKADDEVDHQDGELV
jgi:hypothetical protein